MKKQYISIANIIKASLFSGLLLGSSVSVFAKDNKKEALELSAQPAVTYVGSENDNASFAVHFETATPVNFDLIIKDAAGVELYRGNFESAKFNKVFQLVNESDNGETTPGFTFYIRVAGGKEYQYTANTTVSLVKEVQISKI